MPINQEPTAEHNPNPETRAHHYTSEELDNIAADIHSLRRYQLYHPERSHIRHGKKEEFRYESRSPYFQDLLEDKDWAGLVNEVASRGASTGELTTLTNKVVDLVLSGEFDSVDGLFSQLRLRQVSLGSKISIPNQSYISEDLRIQKAAQNIAFLALDPLTPPEQRQRHLSEHLDDKDSFIARRLSEIEDSIRSNDRPVKNSLSQSKKSASENIEGEFRRYVSRHISSALREAVSSFEPSSRSFPDFSSNSFGQLNEDSDESYQRQILESIGSNLLSQYHAGEGESQHAIRVLSHLDPELALSETIDDQESRKGVITEIIKDEPDLGLFLVHTGQISQTEIDQLGGFSNLNPNFFLTSYKKLDLLESEIAGKLSDVIKAASTEQILAVSQIDERVANIILSQPEARAQVASEIAKMVEQSHDPITAIFIVSTSRLGNMEEIQGIYSSVIKKAAESLRDELSQKFDLNNPLIIFPF